MALLAHAEIGHAENTVLYLITRALHRVNKCLELLSPSHARDILKYHPFRPQSVDMCRKRCGQLRVLPLVLCLPVVGCREVLAGASANEYAFFQFVC